MGDIRRSVLVAAASVLLSSLRSADGQQAPTPTTFDTAGVMEAFLSSADIVSAAPADGRRSWRATLAGAAAKHDASVETADGNDPTRRNYRYNVAAYELDKLLGLDLVLPSVEREVNGRAASLTWWVDDLAMNELDRRRKGVDPPDADRWNRGMQAVRVFDELIANVYRSPQPPLYLNTVWDNLLITRSWRIWLTDHTGAFQNRARLEDEESLTRCPRLLLAKLRSLKRPDFERRLGKYLSSQQLTALDTRRGLLVKHFDRQIARKGEGAVLYEIKQGVQ